MMESTERGRPLEAVAMEFPVSEGVLSCSPPIIPPWLRSRLSEAKTPTATTVEEIEAKLLEAGLRRQKFYESLSNKARAKPRSPSRSSSNEDDLGQRLEAKLLAAEEKRLSIIANAQRRLAKLHELRKAAKMQAEIRFKKEQAELGTKVQMRVQQAEANRLLLLRAYRERRATLKERASQSLTYRMARESKYKERVRAAISQKRAAAEKRRLGLLEAEKRRARARILQIQKAASSISCLKEIERSEMKNKLEDKLQRACRKRAEYLLRRGRQYSAFYDCWETMHEQAETLAVKLARCWIRFKKLRKTTANLSKAYHDLNINESAVKLMPFEQFALFIQSTATIQTAKGLLDRLEVRYRLSKSIPSGCDDIDHLLKRVASPKKRESPMKSLARSEERKTISVEQKGKTPFHLSRYQVRIVLCAYMILGHPDAVISGQGERETALVKSAETFVKEFDLLIKIMRNGPVQVPDEGSDNGLLTPRTFRLQLAAFDSAWCSFLNSFVVWKAKDAKSLEEDLVRAACRLELSMIQTCKMTPEGVSALLSHDMKAIQKQVSADQKLLREKVLHLSGDAGIERMENALSSTRVNFFNAKRNDSPITSLTTVMLSPNSASSPSPRSSTSLPSPRSFEPSKPNSQNQSLVVRSLFRAESSSSTCMHVPSETPDLENVKIVNEYVHGDHLSLADSCNLASEYECSIMAKLKETMERAFWDGIIESVRQEQPDNSNVLVLIREVRDGICAIAPRSWTEEISEAIDLEVLTQLLDSGKLDIIYLGQVLEYALSTLRKLSAPAYEAELEKRHQKFMVELADTCGASASSEKSQVIALIKGLRYVLEQMQELKQQIGIARIRMLEPLLKGPEALYFLGRAFTSRYGHPSNAETALPLTAKWLSSVRKGKDEEWDDHKNALSEAITRRDNSSSFLPSTTLRTGASPLLKMSGNEADATTSTTCTYIETIDPHLECKGEEMDLLVRLGLLKLVTKIPGLTEGELPETMILNFYRLRSVQSRVQKIIVIATSLLVLRQTLLSQQLASSQVHMDGILASCFKQLSKCLDSVPDAGIQEIVDVLVAAVVENNNSGDGTKSHAVKETMERILCKSLQEDDPVFTRVSRAVYLATRDVSLGGTGKQGRELAEMSLQKVGASQLIDEVVRAASVLVVAAKASVLVHGPWYANLMK